MQASEGRKWRTEAIYRNCRAEVSAPTDGNMGVMCSCTQTSGTLHSKDLGKGKFSLPVRGSWRMNVLLVISSPCLPCKIMLGKNTARGLQLTDQYFLCYSKSLWVFIALFCFGFEKASHYALQAEFKLTM